MINQINEKEHLFYIVYNQKDKQWNIKDNKGKIFGIFFDKEIAVKKAIKIASKTENGRVSLR